MAVSLSSHKGTATKTRSRLRRQIRGRKKIFGAPERPRLVVTRSAKHISAQVIDDVAGRTLASASTMEADLRTATATSPPRPSRSVAWSPSAPRPPASSNVVFDRAGNKYHGRIAALADGAREGGLGF